MGYRLNRITEPVFIAVSKLLLTEFGIHYRLESCGGDISHFPEKRKALVIKIVGAEKTKSDYNNSHNIAICKRS